MWVVRTESLRIYEMPVGPGKGIEFLYSDSVVHVSHETQTLFVCGCAGIHILVSVTEE